jgi:hypothetical protein
VVEEKRNIEFSDRAMDVSQKVVREMKMNHVIEFLDIDEWWVRDENQRVLMNRYLHLDRAGRRFVKTNVTDRLPMGMWPIVLERVQTKLFPTESTNHPSAF